MKGEDLMKSQMVYRGSLFSLVIVFVLLFALHGTTYGEPIVSISPMDQESPAAGEQITVEVDINGAPDIGTYDFNLVFDPTALSYVDVEFTDYLPGDQTILSILDLEIVLIKPKPAHVEEDPDTGLATFVGRSISAHSLVGVGTGAGTLARITFDVLEVKDSMIQLVNVSMFVPGSTDPVAGVMTANGTISAPAPETPETPEVPETPETPEMPETPEVPEVPETPEVPEVPDSRSSGSTRNPRSSGSTRDPRDSGSTGNTRADEGIILHDA